MKKILTSIIVVMLFSCSSSSELEEEMIKEESVKEEIIEEEKEEEPEEEVSEGEKKWELESIIDSGIDITTICDKKNILNFEAGNTKFEQIFFDTNGNDCAELPLLEGVFDLGKNTFKNPKTQLKGNIDILDDKLIFTYTDKLEGTVITFVKK